jgi:hypothetical protein
VQNPNSVDFSSFCPNGSRGPPTGKQETRNRNSFHGFMASRLTIFSKGLSSEFLVIGKELRLVQSCELKIRRRIFVCTNHE